MARSRTDLQTLLSAIPGVAKVYFQAPTTLVYPCIIYEHDDEYVSRASDRIHFFKKRYTITVIDRDPDSSIPDVVRGLPYSSFDRKFVVEGLHHTVYNLYF